MRGMGRRGLFWQSPQPAWGQYPAWETPSKEEQKTYLMEQADALKAQLEQIRKAIEDLEKE
jgi:hypothetical protein